MSFEKASLGKYVRVVGGFAFKSEDFADVGIPVVRISDLRDDSVFVTEAAKIPSEKVGRGQNYQIEPGDILIAMSGATTGKIGVVPESCIQPVLQNQRVGNFKIIDPSRIYRRYLKHYLVSSTYQAQIWQLMVGVAQPNISSKQLEQIEIPLPPIAEQKRIAAILDRAEELRNLRRQALEQLDAMTQSIFLEMFGDPSSNLKRWDVKSMGECAQKIQIGPFGTQLHEEDYIDNGIPSINPMHIQGGKIVPNRAFSVSVEKYKQLSQYHLEIHDVILGRRGEMGRCAVVTEVENGWLCGTGSLFVRPIHSLINSVYLFTLLSSKSIKKYLERASQGVTMANLNKTIVSQIPVTVPPLPLQQEFARRVEAIEELKATHRESLAHLDALFASLQHRAFRGDL